MRRWLAILVFLLSITSYNRAECSSSALHQKPSNSIAATASPQQFATRAPSDQAQPERKLYDPKTVRVILPPKDVYDRTSFWVSVVLAAVGVIGIAVGIFTLCFLRRQVAEMGLQRIVMGQTLTAIRKQAGLMERQTVVAEIASKNATESIGFFVNAERARITMDIGEMGRSFSIKVKNTGKAMAKVLYAKGVNMVLPYGENLPPEPPYLSEKRTDFSECLNPTESLDIFNDRGEYGLLADLSSVELCEQIRDKKVALWVFGRIVYEDGISPVERETRFCYEALVEPPLSTYLAMGGPPEYRLMT